MKRQLAGVVRIVCVLIVFAAFGGQAGSVRAQPDIPDFKLLYYAAQLANEAYDGRSDIFGELDGKNAQVAIPGETRVQYVLNFNHRRRIQVVSVRGSDNDTNMALDKDTVLVPDRKIRISLHRGFRTAAMAIYNDVKPKLRRDYTTYLVGHSLGGSVAVILGMYLLDDGVQIGRILTFGQPKLTNSSGAQAYRSLPLVRVIYQNDVVTLLPVRSKNGRQPFAHMGRALNLLSGPHYVSADVEKSIRLSPRSFARMFGQASIPDHKMKWYLQGLKDKLGGAIRVRFSERNRYIVRHKTGRGVDTAPPEKSYNFNQRN